jgi:predicted XRE-type DNA-binding protein
MMPKQGNKQRKTQPALVSKAVLAKEVARILDERGLTQTEAAYLIKDAPSQISLMVTGKTKGFSAERLLRTLTRLGRDVDIVIRRTAGKRAGKVRLSVR